MGVLASISKGLYSLSSLGLSKGPHITRYTMYRHLERHRAPRGAEEKVLSISRSEGLARLLGFADAQVTDASYPACSVLDLPFADGSFDAVVSDQVLEHVEGDPQRAFDECFRVLRPGGIALHTTCFINPVHEHPGDFWRFTPSGLALLCKGRAEVLDAGGWGNPGVWPFALAGLRFEPIPHARWHPAHWLATWNVREWAVVTWVVARRY